MIQLYDRIEQEKNESFSLANYAVKSVDSIGRRHLEPEHPYRTGFQRDRDRIIHSAAFRRLEAKTQVFAGGDSDYYRTRLTHTIEMAQITRTMARILRVNEDLAEAAALAHDLGHPPYGHWGETVLNELMERQGGFEHNCHSLRIVEYLEHPYPSFRGLNLMYETRECLAKHESRYDHPDHTNEYGSGKAPLEGQIADLADEIAYNSHDLDDALACGLLCESDLEHVSLYQEVKKQVDQKYPQAKRLARQLRTAKAIIDLLIMDALEQTVRSLQEQRPETPDQVRRQPKKLVCLSRERQRQMAQLETFLLEKVYRHPDLIRAEQQTRSELQLLFTRFTEDPSLLPARYQSRLDQQGIERVVCDYLAGMTDRFCHEQYQKIIPDK